MKLLLDVTTMVTLISDITFDKTLINRFGGLEEWKKISSEIYKQLINELEDPIYSKLEKELNGHEWLATKSAIDKTYQLIKDYGTPTEFERMYKLFDKIISVPDDPSDLCMTLKGRQWEGNNCLNKKIIGTAHKHGYKLITGNLSIVSAAINGDYLIEFDYLVHRPRCFLGKKYEVENIEKQPDGTYKINYEVTKQ
jgi:hypothetical protein